MKKFQRVFYRNSLFVIGAAFLVIIIFLISSHSSTYTKLISPKSEEKVANVCNFRRIVDGVCVATEAEANPELVAVMVENHVDARPQAGLTHASIVYEAPVEANYTRFLALFPVTENVEKVGPVRSARPYYVDWVSEWGKPLYMHVGGSPDALDLIKTRNIVDANEFYFGNYFWRSSDRFAPHNTYTKTDKWQKLISDKKINLVPPTSGWEFTTSSQACVSGCVANIKVNFLPPAYAAEWRYTTTTNQYARYQMGKPHNVEEGNVIADTIIIQHVTEKVLDEKGRLSLTDVGRGAFEILQNGEKITGHWEKSTPTGHTNWFDEQNRPVQLHPGKIWVEVVPQNGSVYFSASTL